MKLILSLLVALLSFSAIAQTKTTKSSTKAPAKKPKLPLIGPGTVLVYSLSDEEDQDNGTLVVRIKTISPSLTYDFTIVNDNADRPRNGREGNTALELKSLDTIEGIDKIAQLFPPEHYRYQSLLISTNAFATL